MPARPTASAEAVDEDAIRRVAGVLAQGRVPKAEELAGLADRHLDWLRVLDRRQLSRIMVAEKGRVVEHVRGRFEIPGVPASDRATVSTLKARAAAPAPSPTARDRRQKVEETIAALEGGDPGNAWTPAM